MATLVKFRESSFSPWGNRPRSGHRSPLSDASEKYLSCTGSISAVNHILAEKGLHYPTTVLPPLAAKPLTASNISFTSSKREDLDEIMAHGPRRGRRHPNVKKPPQPPTVSPVKKEVKLPTTHTSAPKDLPPPSEESKLVELASFPGFDPHHTTPLPHGLDPLEQMQRTSRAQTMLSVKREGFRETWKKLFYKPSSMAIFQDYFWWFFLHMYQSTKLLCVQNQLFNRISANYVSLLSEDVDLRWRDPFFRVYPDMMAQCVYSAFVHAYPASWTSFDDNFKSELIKIISLWQVGTRPLPNTWKKWNFSVLEPTNELKHLSKEKSEEGSSSARKKVASFELDTLLKEQDEKEKKSPEKSEAKENPDCEEPVRISLSNFDEELALSLANKDIHMSASKERLVKTQAQATRELLTKKTRAEQQPQAELPVVNKHGMSRSQSRRLSLDKGAATKGQIKQSPPKSSPATTMQVSSSKNPVNGPIPAPKVPLLGRARAQKNGAATRVVQAHPRAIASTQPKNRAQVQRSRIAQPNQTSRHPPVAQRARTESNIAVHSQTASQQRPTQPHNNASVRLPAAKMQSPQKVVPPNAPLTRCKSQNVQQRPSQPHNKALLPAAQTQAPHKAAQPNAAPTRCKPQNVPTSHRPSQVSVQVQQRPHPKGQNQQSRSPQASTQATPKTATSASVQKPQTQASPSQRGNAQSSASGKAEQKQTGDKAVAKNASNTVVWKEKAMEILKRSKASEAPATVPPVTFEKVTFDVYGQSPLVRHFMNERTLSRENETKVLTGRTELVEEPEVDMVSYEDILSDALETELKNHKVFNNLYKETKKSMAKAQAVRLKASYTHEQNVKLMLAMKNEVRQLSNELVTHILNKHSGSSAVMSRDTISAVIEKTLNRITKTASV